MDCTMQIDDDDIQSLLNELKLEVQKCETDTVMQKELEDISMIIFAKNIESIIDKLFYVSVKICDSFNELEALDIATKYSEILDGKSSCYVVQCFVSNIFQSRLINSNWIANVCIRNDDTCVYKTVQLKNLLPHNTFNIVVFFPKSTKPVTVTTNLLLSSEGYWSNIKVSSIKTDISYHFIPFYEHKIIQIKKSYPLFQISKLYTDDVKLKLKQPIFKYRFNCNSDVQHLFETVLKNCIHKLDVSHMQEIAAEGVSNVQLYVNDIESTIHLYPKNSILNISGSYETLCAIKLFLIQHLQKGEEKITVNSSFLIQLQNLRMKLHEERSQREINFDNLKMLYEEYKNLIAALPI